VTTAFREQGRLRVLELAGNGTPVAIVCNLVAGDTVFWFKTAFDETYRKASPGVQLTYAARDDFYEHDARLLDSCSAPDSPVVNKVLPDRRPVATLVIGPAGLRGTLMRGAAHAAVRVRARRKAAERSRS
jgi:CelD/BcsL family acetyltransferase involved in cellulose biosynthesis